MVQVAERRRYRVPQSIFIQLEVANTDDKWLRTASFKIPNERFLIFFKFIMPLGEKVFMSFLRSVTGLH